MPIYSADLQPVHPVSFLWVLPLLPAAGAAVLVLLGRAPGGLSSRTGQGGVKGAVAATVAVFALGAAAGVALVAALGVLVPLPPGARGLLDARGLLVEAGIIRVGASLALDPLSAVLSCAVALAGVAIAVSMAAGPLRSDPLDGDRPFGALSALVASALLLVLAENFFLMLVAWEAATLCLYVLAAGSRVSPDAAPAFERARAASQVLVVGRVGLGGLMAGVALLFWGLGAGVGFARPGAGGPLSVTADVRGAGGAGIELRTKGDRPPTASIREIPVGPTLAFREIADQLALQDAIGRHPFADALAAQTFGRLPLLLLMCLGFLAAAVTRLAWLLLAGGAPGESRATILGRAALFSIPTIGGAVYVVARLWFVFTLSPAAAGTAVVVGLVAAVGVARLVAGRVGAFRSRIDTLFHELGVLPVNDFALAARWLERRVLDQASRAVVLVTLVTLIVLLAR
jgi:hypothetical protein